jgi:hypothetical protein
MVKRRKSEERGKKNEESTKSILGASGFFVSGTWNGWDRTPDFADCTVLHGDRVLLCEEFKEVT